MLIGIVGVRGTVPDAHEGTVSVVVDNHLVFDVPSEFVHCFESLRENWKKIAHENPRLASKYGNPTFGRLQHIFLTHLHWDHWGGLRHLLHRSLLLEGELRTRERPFEIYIARGSGNRFLARLRAYFGDSIPFASDAEMVEFMLCLDLGLDARDIFRIRIVKPGDVIDLGEGYQVCVAATKHMKEGSVAYKVLHTKRKLDVGRARELNVPFNRNLGILDRKGSVMLKDRILHSEEVFVDRVRGVGYSGDSPVDSDLVGFFAGCDLLIHEATYLDRDPDYFLESHAALPEVFALSKEISGVKTLVPLHFSIRHNWDEIEAAIASIRETSANLQILGVRSGSFIELDDNSGKAKLLS